MATFNAYLQDGVDESDSLGMVESVTVGGVWAVGDTWTLSLSDLSGDFTIGAGRVSGAAPVAVLTLNGKVYLTSEDTLYFSAIEDAEGWEQQDIGAGFIQMSNRSSAPEDLLGLASYQGKLAVFSRTTTQIWGIDPDPGNYAQAQVLPNVGTVAPLSVQAVGDMDVYFVSDSGIRSLRVRDSSGNAIVADMGTPIDSLVQSALQVLTDAQKAAICSTVEPSSNRYLCFIPNAAGTDGDIYVLSYFPTSGVQAWSTYKPTYDLAGVQTTFIPTKFATVDGQVFVRAGNKVFAYGGADGITYDAALATWRTPYLDAKTPAMGKQAKGVDAALEGAWTLKASMDPLSQIFETVYIHNEATYWQGFIPYTGYGTHIAFEGTSSAASAARLAMGIFHFEPAET